jgi:hypothetical protein
MDKDELLRQALLARARNLRASLSPKVEEIDGPVAPPRSDTAAETTDKPKEKPTNFRGQFSKEGMDLATAASSGLYPYNGGGVVDIPDVITADQIGIPKGGTLATSGPLYALEGEDLPVPKILQDVFEFLGNAVATAGGLGQAGYGYLIGGAADILVKAGMDKNSAERMANTAMALPEAFVGSPQQLMRASGGVKVSAKKPAAITTATISKFFSPEDIAKLQSLEIATPPRANAPMAAVGGRIEPPVSRAIPASAGAALPELSEEQIGTIVRGASAGNKKAINDLIEAARINPEAVAAAERLGIDLPPDVLADSQLIREAAGLTRSIAGTEASAAWRETLVRASEAADEAILALGGSPDLASVSEGVRINLTGTHATLKKQASDLYNGVDEVMPKSTIVSPDASTRLLNDLTTELGGAANLSPIEKKLFNTITSPTSRLTYAALVRLKQDVGRAIGRGDGPYSDINQSSLKRIYAAISEDQLSTVEIAGGPELRKNLRLANQITAKQKALEKRIVGAFGKDLDGSIATVLRTAITSGAKGDISALNKILKTVPQELHREVIASAINSLSTSARSADVGFGFAEYTKLYKGLRSNAPVYDKILKTLGPEARQLMDDLYIVSKRVTDARANVLTTGKANQALVNAMTAEKIMSKFLDTNIGRRAVQGVTTAGGAVVAGPVGAMGGAALADLLKLGSKDRIAEAGRLFSSQQFKEMVTEAAKTGTVSSQTAAKLEKSPAFKRFAGVVGITDTRNWLQTALLIGENEGVINPAEAPAPAPETINESPALQSLLQAMTPAQRAKIQQAVP